MTSEVQALQAGLDALLPQLLPQAQRCSGLQRLSAGATLQTWSFDAVGDGNGADGPFSHPLILRRSPGGLRGNESLSLPLEADLVRTLAGSGVPVADVLHTLQPGDGGGEGLGDGFIMTRIPGETIARKILRDADYATARSVLVRQLGMAAGALHTRPLASLPDLPVRSTAATLHALQRRCQALPQPDAVFEFALRWLQRHQPGEPATLRLVHGDFRLGNVIVGPEGLRAVLDWEIAHLGDPAEDLAWMCLPPWRFGQITQPVAGLGQRSALFAAWQAATGEPVDAERVRWWQAAGSLRWGLGCAGMRDWFESGRDPTVERAMIARRVSENQIDLLRLLDSEDACA